jgi:hypothetical protein
VQVVPSSGEVPAVDIVTEANKWMNTTFTNMDQEQERVRTGRNQYEPNPWLEKDGMECPVTGNVGCLPRPPLLSVAAGKSGWNRV